MFEPPPELRHLEEVESVFPQVRETLRGDGLIIQEHIVGRPRPASFDETPASYKYEVRDIRVKFPDGRTFSFVEKENLEGVKFYCHERDPEADEGRSGWYAGRGAIGYHWEDLTVPGYNLGLLHEIGHIKMKEANPILFEQQEKALAASNSLAPQISQAEIDKVIGPGVGQAELWCWDYARRKLLEYRKQGFDLEPNCKTVTDLDGMIRELSGFHSLLKSLR